MANDEKLGQILIRLGFANPAQVAEGLEQQEKLKSSGQKVLKIGEILMLQGAITLDQLREGLRAQTNKAAESRKQMIEAKQRLEQSKASSAADLARTSKAPAKEKPQSGGIFGLFKKS